MLSVELQHFQFDASFSYRLFAFQEAFFFLKYLLHNILQLRPFSLPKLSLLLSPWLRLLPEWQLRIADVVRGLSVFYRFCDRRPLLLSCVQGPKVHPPARHSTLIPGKPDQYHGNQPVGNRKKHTLWKSTSICHKSQKQSLQVAIRKSSLPCLVSDIPV